MTLRGRGRGEEPPDDDLRAEVDHLVDMASENRGIIATFLQDLDCGLAIFDTDGNLVFRNQTAAEIWASNPDLEENTAMSPWMRYRAKYGAEEILDLHDWALHRCTESGERSELEQLDIERLDGSEGTIYATCAPVRNAHDEIVGGLTVFVDITRLKQFERAEHRARLAAERSAMRLTQLQTVITGLLSPESPAEITRAVLRRTLRALKAQTGVAYLLDHDSKTARLVASLGVPTEIDEKYEEISFEDPLPVSEAMRLSTPVIISSAAEYRRRYPQLAEDLPRQHINSVACLPLLVEDEVLGALAVGFDHEHLFDEHDRAFFNAVARQTGQAVRFVRLHEQKRAARNEAQQTRDALDRRLEQQVAVAELGQRALNASLDELFEVAVETLRDGLGADTAEILELLPREQEFRLRAGIGWSDDHVDHHHIPADVDTPAGRALRQTEVVLVERFEQAGELRPSTLLANHGLVSAITARIPGQRSPVGVLGAHSHTPMRFSEQDAEFARSVANILGEAVERQRSDQQRRRTYEELRRAMRSREEVLDIISHDIRSPASAVKMSLEVVRRAVANEQAISPDQVDHAIETASSNVDRMLALMDDLLSAASSDEELPKVEWEEVDLSEVIREIIDGMRDELEETSSDLEFDLGDSVTGCWDWMRLQQLVSNLFSNAVKYGEDNPITISTRAENDHAILRIKDRGKGIPQDQQNRIFERFARGTEDRQHGSFGLGLWIVKRIVDALHGTIEVDSAPGEGTTFTVRLPRNPPDD